LRKAILQRAVDPTAGSQDERVYQRRPASVQHQTGMPQRPTDRLGGGGLSTQPAELRDQKDPRGPPGEAGSRNPFSPDAGLGAYGQLAISGPACRDGALTPGPNRAELDATSRSIGRFQQASGQLELRGRKLDPAGAAFLQHRQGAAEASYDQRRSQETGERTSRHKDCCDRYPGYDARVNKTQKAGRKTGRIAEREQDRWARSHGARASGGLPLPAARSGAPPRSCARPP